MTLTVVTYAGRRRPGRRLVKQIEPTEDEAEIESVRSAVFASYAFPEVVMLVRVSS